MIQSVFYAKQFKEDPHTKKSFQIEKIGKVGLIAFKRRKMGKKLLIFYFFPDFFIKLTLNEATFRTKQPQVRGGL